MNKKAQMEIAGLAVVVIILIIGMLFAIRFMFNNEQTGPKASDRQLGNAFVHTVLSDSLYVPSCKQGIELKELIEDCPAPQDRANICQDGTTKYCNKAQEEVGRLLDQLKERGVSYDFTVQDSNENNLINIENSCQAKQTKTLTSYTLPTDYGSIFVLMKICSD